MMSLSCLGGCQMCDSVGVVGMTAVEPPHRINITCRGGVECGRLITVRPHAGPTWNAPAIYTPKIHSHPVTYYRDLATKSLSSQLSLAQRYSQHFNLFMS